LVIKTSQTQQEKPPSKPCSSHLATCFQIFEGVSFLFYNPEKPVSERGGRGRRGKQLRVCYHSAREQLVLLIGIVVTLTVNLNQNAA
jgi:hypothetical protein